MVAIQARGRGHRPPVHVCGGAQLAVVALAMLGGPFPRVRGSPRRGVHRRSFEGSIPACAGEPGRRIARVTISAVHPRVCGGASNDPTVVRSWWGPSPRVRGSLARASCLVLSIRSIPACAGEPPPEGHMSGPSPRVRGSPRRVGHRVGRRGSIPACAGEPQSCAGCAWPASVHPRVRGSPDHDRLLALPARSIPACAGEPEAMRAAVRRAGVHPRVCGGAISARADALIERGPSPRVRGSPRLERLTRPALGSIPACAGEPAAYQRSSRAGGVHPRVCGGADADVHLAALGTGPSPRVRGSRGESARRGSEPRSIPACAGEPLLRHHCACGPGVHPRVCGGAARSSACAMLSGGPSPRVRGSRRRAVAEDAWLRSIPACAGEPPARIADASAGAVHPRVCGGAHKGEKKMMKEKGPSPRVRGSHTRTPQR